MPFQVTACQYNGIVSPGANCARAWAGHPGCGSARGHLCKMKMGSSASYVQPAAATVATPLWQLHPAPLPPAPLAITGPGLLKAAQLFTPPALAGPSGLPGTLTYLHTSRLRI